MQDNSGAQRLSDDFALTTGEERLVAASMSQQDATQPSSIAQLPPLPPMFDSKSGISRGRTAGFIPVAIATTKDKGNTADAEQVAGVLRKRLTTDSHPAAALPGNAKACKTALEVLPAPPQQPVLDHDGAAVAYNSPTSNLGPLDAAHSKQTTQAVWDLCTDVALPKSLLEASSAMTSHSLPAGGVRCASELKICARISDK